MVDGWEVRDFEGFGGVEGGRVEVFGLGGEREGRYRVFRTEGGGRGLKGLKFVEWVR